MSETTHSHHSDPSLYRVSKKFDHNSKAINSIDIRREGDLLATTSFDESIHLYDARTGVLKNKVLSKKYGSDLVKFVASTPGSALTASLNGWDDTIRYVSLTENVYIRYFKGHRSQVTSISTSPTQPDIFTTSSRDDSIRLWDLRVSTCQGFIPEDDPRVAFDPLGIVLACATSNGIINLYDPRQFDGGPFQSWQLGEMPADPPQWSTIQFSNNGRFLLLSTHSSTVHLLDAFNGSQLAQLNSRSNRAGLSLDANFSHDDKYIITGSDNGNVHIYETATGTEVATLAAADTQPIRVAKFHPKHDLLATGSEQLHLWEPLNNFKDENKDQMDTS